MRGTIVLIGSLSFVQIACSSGGGGDDDDDGPPALEITSQPGTYADEGEPYTYDVDASGSGTLVFELTTSPAGMTIDDATGLVDWTPSGADLGANDVEVLVTDSMDRTDTQAFTVDVDPPFVATPSTTDAVEPLDEETIDVSGGLAPYTAVLTVDASGAQISFDGQTVTYTAGSGGGTDVIRVTDTRGRIEDVSFFVGDDAFAGFTERYGTTDNWMLNFDAKRFAGAHAYDSDLQAELVRLGLWTDGTTGAGATHDQLAESFVTLQIMRHVSTRYLNDYDGTPSTLAISIFGDTPATGSSPSPGTAVVGGPNLFNVMEISTQESDSVLGRAFLDNGNGAIEHDGGEAFGGTELGVDITDCTDNYLIWHPGNVLSPAIDAGDVAALQNLLAGDPPGDAREQAIFDLVDHYAFRIAIVVAHEIGHSVGHDHNGTSGSIMFPSISFANGIDPQFLAAEVTTMQSDLPGPGRSIGSLVSGASTPLDLPVVEMRVGADGGVGCSCGERLW